MLKKGCRSSDLAQLVKIVALDSHSAVHISHPRSRTYGDIYSCHDVIRLQPSRTERGTPLLQVDEPP